MASFQAMFEKFVKWHIRLREQSDFEREYVKFVLSTVPQEPYSLDKDLTLAARKITEQIVNVVNPNIDKELYMDTLIYVIEHLQQSKTT